MLTLLLVLTATAQATSYVQLSLQAAAPSEGAEQVPLDATPTIALFGMKHDHVDASDVLLLGPDGPVAAAVHLDRQSWLTVATLEPAQPLAPDTAYTVQLGAHPSLLEVYDAVGADLAEDELARAQQRLDDLQHWDEDDALLFGDLPMDERTVHFHTGTTATSPTPGLPAFRSVWTDDPSALEPYFGPSTHRRRSEDLRLVAASWTDDVGFYVMVPLARGESSRPYSRANRIFSWTLDPGEAPHFVARTIGPSGHLGPWGLVSSTTEVTPGDPEAAKTDSRARHPAPRRRRRPLRRWLP